MTTKMPLFKKLKNFLIVYAVVFIILFLIFNGRAIFAQIKYSIFNIFNQNNTTPNLLPLANDISKNEMYIYIPKLRIGAPVIFSSENNNKAIQKDLEKGVVLYKGSGDFDIFGTPIIIGHSSAFPWYKGNYGSVFALLNRLSLGDEIIIYKNNKAYIYKVETNIADSISKINSYLNKYNNSNGKKIILLSCWPIGTDWKRIAIVAELQQRS